jgi:hypothetical protein
LRVSGFSWLLSVMLHAGMLYALAQRSAGDRLQLAAPAGLNVTFVSTAAGEEMSGSTGEGPFADHPGAAPKDQSTNEPIPPEPDEIAAAPPVIAERRAMAWLDDEGQRPVERTTAKVRPASTKAKRANAAQHVTSADSEGPPGRSSDLGSIGDGRARTEVFGAIGEGRKFVYVFDRSGSMDGHKGAPLIAAKAELLASLKDLGQTQQFQIIFYNEQPRVFNPSGTPGRLVFGTDQNKYLAQKFVGGITADGATHHEEALALALKMSPDVVFFLTDADEPKMDEKQLARIARLNRGATIHAIEFGYGPQRNADNFLGALARRNGGKHVYVDVSRLPAARR